MGTLTEFGEDTGQAVSAKFQTAESSTTGGFEGPSHILGAVASSNLAQGWTHLSVKQ
jgi:hypothetical protein